MLYNITRRLLKIKKMAFKKPIIKTNLKDSDLVSIKYNGTESEMTVEDFKNSSRGYRVYRALLTQTGTDAPVATVLENTLGDVSWSYDSVGNYSATRVGGFTEAKTLVIHGTSYASDPSASYKMYAYSDDVLYIECRTGTSTLVVADVQLSNTSIEIKVYD